jgi:hypothetical protein
MPKMNTLRKHAIGRFKWPENRTEKNSVHDEARIERNTFSFDGETIEALRFCKTRNGRHTRVHLVIGEDEFVELFRNAVENNVFHPETLAGLRSILGNQNDPLAEVIGIAHDGRLAHDIDEELYGERPA